MWIVYMVMEFFYLQYDSPTTTFGQYCGVSLIHPTKTNIILENTIKSEQVLQKGRHGIIWEVLTTQRSTKVFFVKTYKINNAADYFRKKTQLYHRHLAGS